MKTTYVEGSHEILKRSKLDFKKEQISHDTLTTAERNTEVNYISTQVIIRFTSKFHANDGRAISWIHHPLRFRRLQLCALPRESSAYSESALVESRCYS